jgi:inhibitor of cysteine peptidase
MKKITLIISGFILAFGITACNSTQKQLRQIGQEKIDADYTIPVGESVIIELESNPSTGYKWELAGKSYDKIVSLENREYKSENNNQNMVGAGGIDFWTFKGEKQGEVILLLKYQKEDGEIGKETYRKITVTQ